MAGTRIIGAVAVKVRPELGGFRRKTKAGILRQLKDINAEVDVKVDVDVDLDKFRRQLGQLEREAGKSKVTIGVDIEGLKDALKGLDKEIARNSEAMIKLGAKLDEASKREVGEQVDDVVSSNDGKNIGLNVNANTLGASAQLAWVSRDRFADIFARVNKRSIAVAEGMLKSLSGWGVITDAGRAFETLVTQFDRFTVKAGAMGAAIGGVLDSLSYMATSALGIADGILEVVGLSATLPAVLSAVTAAVAINVAAWKGFGDAVDGNAKALAALPPNARKAAKSLQGAWTSIQKPVQKRFWDGMGTELSQLASVIIPQFRDGLANSAEHVGEFGAGVSRAFKKISLNGDLKKMFKGLDGFFDNLAEGAEPFIDALNTLGLRGSEYLPQLGTWLADMAKKFDNFITNADKAGDINRWIEDGIQSLKDMGRTIVGVKDMFVGLTEAARIAGVGGLTEFADTMERIGKMMRSEPFKSRMAEIFSGANEGASALNEGVKELGHTLGESSGFLSDMLKGFGELGGTAIKGVAKAIGNANFQKGILDAVSGLNEGARTLQPAFENVGEIIGTLGTIAGDVFRNISPLLVELSDILKNVVGAIGPALGDMAGNLMNTLGGALKIVNPLITGVATGLGFLLDAFNALPGPIQGVATALGALALFKYGGMFSGIREGVGKMTSVFTEAKPIVSGAQAALGREVVMMQRHLDSLNTTKVDRTLRSIPLTAQRAVHGAKTAFAGLPAALGGGWGIAIAGVVGAIGAIGAASAKEKAHVDSLADSLNGLGATKDTVEIIGKALTTDGSKFSKSTGSIADAAKRLGIELDVLKDAALGSKDAMEQVNSKTDGLSWAGKIVKDAEDTAAGLKEIEVNGVKVNDAINGTSPFIGWLAGFAQSDSDRVINGIREQEDAMKAARDAAMEMAEMKGIDPGWALEYSEAIDTLGDSATDAKSRLQALMTTSKIQAGIQVDLSDFEQTFNDTRRTVTKTMNGLRNDLQESGKKLDVSKYLNKDGVVDTTSEIGSEIRSAMKTWSTDGVQFATLFADSMDNPAQKVEEFKKRMEELREQFNQQFDLDLNTEEFNEVLRGLGIDPVEIETNLNPDGLKEEVKTATDGAKGEVKVDTKVDIQNALSEIRVLNGALDQMVFQEYLAKLGIDPMQFDKQMLDALAQLMGFDTETGTATIDAEDAGFEYTKEGVLAKLAEIDKARADAELTATDGATPVVDGAKKSVGSFKGKDVRVVATFIQVQYQALKNKIGEIKDKAVRVTASFIAQKYSELRGNINEIKDKAVRVTASFIANGYAGVKSKWNSIKSKTVDVVTNFFKKTFTSGMDGGISDASGSLGMAKGLPKSRAIKQFANGGIESHVAQISRSTASAPIRIWAEPETGGEAYIPLSPSKRQRSLAIWKETGKRLGADFYAEGGVMGGQQSSSAPTFNITNHYPVAEKTSTTVNRALQYASIPGLSEN